MQIFPVVRVAVAALALVAATSASAEPRPVVVELFTSQGCSSCPPADALLAELARRDGVIALGFHISYWDRLGWKDPLSSEASTERQKRYARLLGDGRIYTPQIVVDGRSEMVGSDRAAVLAALRRAATAQLAAEPGVRFTADRRSVIIDGGGGRAVAGEVLLVRFTRERVTQIGAGENGGRRAIDVNGVETLSPLGAWDGKERRFSIDPPAAGEGVAVLVQAPDGQILAAAMVPGAG